jgi:hypothetical protein
MPTQRPLSRALVCHTLALNLMLALAKAAPSTCFLPSASPSRTSLSFERRLPPGITASEAYQAWLDVLWLQGGFARLQARWLWLVSMRDASGRLRHQVLLSHQSHAVSPHTSR